AARARGGAVGRRARRCPLRSGQRLAQARGGSRAGAAPRGPALPESRGGCGGARRGGRRDLERAAARTAGRGLRPGQGADGVSAISRVRAGQVLDSRGNPTVEVEVVAGGLGRAIVPSGASTGVHEAVELRDSGAAYGGKGVLQAVANVNGEIADAVGGLGGMNQEKLRRGLVAHPGTASEAP